jgi:NAD(P)-dependent dehydrogenase (short-subunit alcohol dehydrogenase family)
MTGKVVPVTGASSGIGLAAAEALAARGARLELERLERGDWSSGWGASRSASPARGRELLRPR